MKRCKKVPIGVFAMRVARRGACPTHFLILCYIRQCVCALVAKVLMQLQTAASNKSVKRMAFHHAALLFAVLFIWFLVGNAQLMHTESKYFPTMQYNNQQRLTRGIERMKYYNLDLGTARGYGKRSIDMRHANNLLLEWIALETRMRNLGGIIKNPATYQDFTRE